MRIVTLLHKRLFRALSLSAAGCLFLALVSVASPRLWAIADGDDAGEQSARHVLYVLSNDFVPGRNAVIAYIISPDDGSLSPLGTFPTRGTGQSNFDVRLGPDDHDSEVILSADKKFLFAVNAGSNTIAVFRVHSSGRLTHVEGSPF